MSGIVERQGTTILFASHTLAEVEQLADRVAMLDKGKMLAHCSTGHANGDKLLCEVFKS